MEFGFNMFQGHICGCINKSDIGDALHFEIPSHCKIFCEGDKNFFCGVGSGDYWNVYTLSRLLCVYTLNMSFSVYILRLSFSVMLCSLNSTQFI